MAWPFLGFPADDSFGIEYPAGFSVLFLRSHMVIYRRQQLAVLAMGLVLYLFRKNRKVQVAAFCVYDILYGVIYMGLMASYLPDFTWVQLFTQYYEDQRDFGCTADAVV